MAVVVINCTDAVIADDAIKTSPSGQIRHARKIKPVAHELSSSIINERPNIIPPINVTPPVYNRICRYVIYGQLTLENVISFYIKRTWIYPVL